MFARIMVVVGALAALGLAATGWHGYAGFDGRSGLERHILLGLAALLVFATAHCWQLFYLLGLTRVLAESAEESGRRSALEPRLVRFRTRTLPVVAAAVLAAIAVFVVGASMHGEQVGGRYHGPLLWAALALGAWATAAEWRTVIASERALAALRSRPADGGSR